MAVLRAAISGFLERAACMEISAELSIRIRVEMVLQRSGVQKFIGVVGTDLSMPMPAAHIQGIVQVIESAQPTSACSCPAHTPAAPIAKRSACDLSQPSNGASGPCASGT